MIAYNYQCDFLQQCKKRYKRQQYKYKILIVNRHLSSPI